MKFTSAVLSLLGFAAVSKAATPIAVFHGFGDEVNFYFKISATSQACGTSLTNLQKLPVSMSSVSK